MNELVFCEFPWQVELIEHDMTGNELVVALNPASAYALERRGIPFSEIRRHYSHEELWAQYTGITQRTLCLTERLDDIVRQADSRFRENGLRCFDFLAYTIKIAVDQVTYFLHVFSRLLSQQAISKVKCLELKGPYWDDLVLYQENFSLASFALALLKDQYKFQLDYLQYPPAHCPDGKVGHSPFSFGQPKVRVLVRRAMQLRDRLLGIRDACSRSRVNILSVSCRELETLRDPLRKQGIRLLTYHDGIGYTACEGDYLHAEEIVTIMTQDKTFRSLLDRDGIDLFPLIVQTIKRLLNNFEGMLAGYRKAVAAFEGQRIDAVFLTSFTPFYMPNIFVAHLCETRKIPLYCWMHGGYGAYYSLPGYDTVDFRLGKRHCVYGPANKALLESDRCVIHRLGFTNHSVHVVGSPLLEKRYERYVRPGNRKKRILLTIGNYYAHNSFYFGYNRPYAEFCNWDEHRVIIRTLVKHQERYDIIIKDYPGSPMRTTWGSLLTDLHGDRIAVVTGGVRYEDVLKSSDLHIFSWVSTTFMESLLTDADMFLLDQSDLTPEAEACLREDIGFSTDIAEFVAKLDTYLEAGRFYTQKKDRLRSFFMDHPNRGKRADILANLLLGRVGTA